MACFNMNQSVAQGQHMHARMAQPHMGPPAPVYVRCNKPLLLAGQQGQYAIREEHIKRAKDQYDPGYNWDMIDPQTNELLVINHFTQVEDIFFEIEINHLQLPIESNFPEGRTRGEASSTVRLLTFSGGPYAGPDDAGQLVHQMSWPMIRHRLLMEPGFAARSVFQVGEVTLFPPVRPFFGQPAPPFFGQRGLKRIINRYKLEKEVEFLRHRRKVIAGSRCMLPQARERQIQELWAEELQYSTRMLVKMQNNGDGEKKECTWLVGHIAALQGQVQPQQQMQIQMQMQQPAPVIHAPAPVQQQQRHQPVAAQAQAEVQQQEQQPVAPLQEQAEEFAPLPQEPIAPVIEETITQQQEQDPIALDAQPEQVAPLPQATSDPLNGNMTIGENEEEIWNWIDFDQLASPPADGPASPADANTCRTQ